MSKIEWTQQTWNPVTGCTKISAGCLNCYAERMAKRLQAMGQPNYRDGFQVVCHEHVLEAPAKWRKPRLVFVNSMSDLFHPEVSTDFIGRIFEVMRSIPRHRFQFLTKRADRLGDLADVLPWPPNVWAGVTVEDAENAWRIDRLRQVPAAVRFLSLEPLLGPLSELNLSGIDWVIVGGESGPGSRPVRKEWVTDVRLQCEAGGVPFFFKQWGGTNKKAAGRTLDGLTYSEMPVAKRRRMTAQAPRRADLAEA